MASTTVNIGLAVIALLFSSQSFRAHISNSLVLPNLFASTVAASINALRTEMGHDNSIANKICEFPKRYCKSFCCCFVGVTKTGCCIFF